MANVMFDEKTLYYQYMINNNPTSTMLNSITAMMVLARWVL